MDIGNLVTVSILRSGKFYAHENGTAHGPFALSELATGWEFLTPINASGGTWHAIIKRVDSEQSEANANRALKDVAIRELLTNLSIPTLFSLWQDAAMTDDRLANMIEDEVAVSGTRSAEELVAWCNLWGETTQ